MVQIKSLDKVFVERDGVTKSYKTVSGGKVTVLTNAFFDYDGHFIELNEILEGKVVTNSRTQFARSPPRTELKTPMWQYNGVFMVEKYQPSH